MSSDSSVLAEIGAFADEPSASLKAQLVASGLGPLADRVESVAQEFVADSNLEKKTHFRSWAEPLRYAGMSYLLSWVDAIAHMDDTIPINDEGDILKDAEGQPIAQGFLPPPMDTDLLREDYRLRDSFKEGTRKHLRDITKIFEGGQSKGRGFGFRR